MIILNYILLQTPPPPPGNGDTGIDELPLDNMLYLGFIIGIILILFMFARITKQ